MTATKTAVVILNWNGKPFLERFLPILIEHTQDAEIIIADNDSTDGSIAFLKEIFPEIRLIINGQNLGFAGGYNVALSQIEAEYYVLLNSDIEVETNWLQPLIETMDSDPDIAACQPKIIDFTHRNLFEYAGASGGFIDKLGFPFCRGRIFITLEEDTGQYDDPGEVFWATGACMMIRSQVYHQLGGLDEDFFAHMEEIDFCWRLHHHGKKVVVVPESKVYHIGGGTLPKNSSKKTYLNFRNNYLLLYKNLPARKIFPVLTIRLFLDWIAAIKFLIEMKPADFLAVFRAQLHSYFSFRKHSFKRKVNSVFSEKMIYKKSIIQEYYFRKKKKFTDLDQNRF
jgi:GT2 family glycosyltransferase